MLILSRKEGEGITLVLPNGDEISIVLTEYRGKETKVGVFAPDNVTILRDELLRHKSV